MEIEFLETLTSYLNTADIIVVGRKCCFKVTDGVVYGKFDNKGIVSKDKSPLMLVIGFCLYESSSISVGDRYGDVGLGFLR